MHPLEAVINSPKPPVLIGNSSENRFPAMSYHAYTYAGKDFYCLDMGGLAESRGMTKGGKIYRSIEELPEDRDDLAIIWVHPRTAVQAVDLAHRAGCKRVWFSFQTGHRDGVNRARELGMEVVEIGRCPVYYLRNKPAACRAHTLAVRLSGTYRRPPQVDVQAKRRELW